MKYFVLSLLFLNISCNKNPNTEVANLCINPNVKLRKCPKGNKKLFLPRNYAPNALYIGYSSDSNHFLFIKNLIEIMNESENSPIFNILVPREDIVDAQRNFNEYYNHPKTQNIRFSPSVSIETIWMQDYFELLTDTKTGTQSLVDLPYTDREGEMIPTGLSLTCKSELIAGPEFNDVDQPPGNGDYGGNIEPFSTKILVIGNNMTEELIAHLTSLTSQNLLAIDVSWLDTGHVDELFAMLPHSNDSDACDQTIVYSSPAKAFELLKDQNIKEIPKLPTFSYEEIQESYPDYFECLKNFNTPKCKIFEKANLKYQEIIQNNLQLILTAFKELHGCDIKSMPFPQLFTPLKESGEFGDATDRSVAFNQNSVNNIYFWPNLILPKQTIPAFHNYIQSQLAKFPYKVHYSNADFVHTLLGGIHCATNVAYACEP